MRTTKEQRAALRSWAEGVKGMPISGPLAECVLALLEDLEEWVERDADVICLMEDLEDAEERVRQVEKERNKTLVEVKRLKDTHLRLDPSKREM